MEVIPREGVESQSRDITLPAEKVIHVIPREGVESSEANIEAARYYLRLVIP